MFLLFRFLSFFPATLPISSMFLNVTFFHPLFDGIILN